MRLVFECVLEGRVGIKKNSKQIISNRRKLMIVSSSKYKQWEGRALMEVIRSRLSQEIFEPFLGLVEAHFVFYFKNHQAESDVDNLLGGPLDVLQKAKVLENDKQVRKIIAEKKFGKEPHVRIQLFDYSVDPLDACLNE